MLGPIQVSDKGTTITIPAAKERALLAALLANANRTVTIDRLLEALWGEQPPRTAVKTLQTYVGHLRRHVGSRLRYQPPGYVLQVGDGELDAWTFERLVADGRLALLRGDASVAAGVLGDALALWRANAYQDVDAEGAVAAELVRLEELRLAAMEDWLEARLVGSDHAAITAELEALVAQHPMRERMWALLMRALYLSGRQSDALRAYQRARKRLAEDMGLEPGPELVAVEAAILSNEPSLAPAGTDRPTGRYATTFDGFRIGYWTKGEGSRDIVFCAEVTMNLELLWDLEETRPVVDRLISMGRLVAIQRRGTGISDREPGGLSSPDRCVLDLDAVLDDVGVERASLVGWGHGGQVALEYAAARPERVSSLALINAYARLAATPDHPQGIHPESLEQFVRYLEGVWGSDVPKYGIFDPQVATDPALISRFSRFERLTASVPDAFAMLRALNSFDVRDVVPAAKCPALVAFLSGSITGQDNARYLADHLPEAEYVELPGHFVPMRGEARALADALERFLRAPGRSEATPA